MKAKILIFSSLALFVIISSCLTPGDRLDMKEFRRQLEAGGQADEREAKEAGAEAVGEEKAEGKSAPETVNVAAAAVNEEKTLKAAADADKTDVPEKNETSVKIIKAVPAEKITEAESAGADEMPAARSGKKTGMGFAWLVVFVFSAGFAVLSLVLFILCRRKKPYEEAGGAIADDAKPADEPVIETVLPAETGPAAEAVLEIKQPGPASAEDAKEEPAAEKTREDYFEAETQSEEEAAAAEALAKTGALMPEQVAPSARERLFGDGKAFIAPTQFAAGSAANTVSLTCRVAGDSPEYRIIRITVPEGWSEPSTEQLSPGYFKASVLQGSVMSVSAEGMAILISVAGLPAETGEVHVVYGSKDGGGPGAKAQDSPGQAVFKIETEAEGGKELFEIEGSPVVDVN